MNEVWKPIEGATGYEVSDLGRIRSIGLCVNRVSVLGRPYSYTTRPTVIRPGKDGNGYLTVFLQGVGKKVHRLVAMAFLPNPDALPEVNHKDGVKANCRADNLEWCTRGENLRHAYATGLRTPPSEGPSARVPVRATCLRTGKQHEFDSVRDAARRLLGDVKRQPPITHCINGKLRQAYGYTWERI